MPRVETQNPSPVPKTENIWCSHLNEGQTHTLLVNMLADVNIDHVAAFLGDAKSMALLVRASRRTKGIVNANAPAATKAAKHQITKFQK